jgi:competence protein ComEC
MFFKAVLILITVLILDYNTYLVSINLSIIILLISLVFIRFKAGQYFCLTLFTILVFSNYKINLEHERWLLSKFYYKKVGVIGVVEKIINDRVIVKLDSIRLVNERFDNSNNNNDIYYFNNIYLQVKDKGFYNDKASFKNKLKKFNKIKFFTVLKPKITLHNFVDNNSLDNSSYYQQDFNKMVNLNSYKIIDDNNQKKTDLLNKSHYYLSGLRETIEKKITRYLSISQFAAIVKALLLGQKDKLSNEEKILFQNTGTSHLIVISGMHIVFVFGFIYRLSSIIWLCFFYQKFSLSKIDFSCTMAWLLTCFYAFVSGFTIPTQRAILAISIYSITKLTRIKLSIFDIFSICLIVILYSQPLVIYNIGFWLSFSATFYLLYLFANLYNNKNKNTKSSFLMLQHSGKMKPLHPLLRSLFESSNNQTFIEPVDNLRALGGRNYANRFLRVRDFLDKLYELFESNLYNCTYMFIAVIPLSIFYFNKISILSLMANIVAVPIISMAVLPLLIVLLVLVIINFGKVFDSIINLCINLSDFFIKYLIEYLNILNNSDFNLYFISLDHWSIFVLFVLIILVLLPNGIPRLNLVFILCLILIFTTLNKSKSLKDSLIIDIFDIGQGLSVLINTNHHQLLYDTGPKIYGDYGVEKILLNSILSYKRKLDTIVISHWDNDHSGNLQHLLQLNKPTYIYSSQLGLKNIDNGNFQSSPNIPHFYCNEDITWFWDNIEFSFIKTYPDHLYRGNNSSCVLKIVHDNTSVLLTGDIEYKTEQQLVSNYSRYLKSDILLVPHHGSKTSSSENFIKQVAPKYALISVGKDNIYHLPNDIVINRYASNDIKIYRTDHNGAIRVIIKDNKTVIKTKL